MSTDWSDVRRVLAIRLDQIGDVLMTTPSIRAIREAGCHVTLLTAPASVAAAAMIPEISDVIGYAAPWMKASRAQGITNDYTMIGRLAEGQYDAAVIFTCFSQTPFPAAMLARLAGIPRILMHARERAYALASDTVPETEPEQGIRHEVRRQLDLVASVGWRPSHERLSLAPPFEAALLAETFVPKGPWALVHPGSTAPSRRWPAESFAALVNQLTTQQGWAVLVAGSEDETALCAQVAGQTGVNLAGKLDLPAFAALVGQAPVLIANNSGPAHIAAAMGTPVVDLYALTNPQHTPWGVPTRVLNHDVACRWCYASVCRTGHHLCLRGVTPEMVVDAAVALARPGQRRAA